MPRTARKKSKTGIYHLILRGANRQEIFHDKQDNIRFIDTIEKYKETAQIKIYGWCLMNNHIHLLIEEGKEDISTTMKRISVSYVYYYNWKYKTTGHLFQDRFRSENIETDAYLLTVIRYIHQNPVNAGIVNKPNEWEWSSCNEYYGISSHTTGLLDKELILEIFSEQRTIAIKNFIEFNEEDNSDKCLDNDLVKRLRDEEARVEIDKLITGTNIAQIKSLPKEQRNKIIRKAKQIEGISQRQLSRIIGVSQTLISTL